MAQVSTPQPSGHRSSTERRRISGRSVALIFAVVVLVIFIVQNTEDVKLTFLVFSFTWPLWLYTLVVAAFGAAVWFGLGVMRRHRRRKERRAERS